MNRIGSAAFSVGFRQLSARVRRTFFTRPDVTTFYSRAWNSAVFNTWASLAVRILNVIVLLPLGLRYLPVADFAVWLLLTTFASLQLLFDMGFSQTFSRMIAFAMAGVPKSELGAAGNVAEIGQKPNYDSLSAVLGTTVAIYRRLTLASIALLSLGGVTAMAHSIAATTSPHKSWVAFGATFVATILALWGSRYSAYLIGIDRIAVLRRWETLTGLAVIPSGAAVLLAGGGLLGLVLVSQVWVAIGVLRNVWLCRRIAPIRLTTVRTVMDPIVITAVWPAAWRSAVGIWCGFGTMQLSAFVVTRVVAPDVAAAYLLAVRFIQAISQFSQAPFYTRLPRLARFRASGDLVTARAVARHGMAWSYWCYLAGALSVAVFIEPILTLLGSQTNFVSPFFWCVMSVAYFVERYGAMHLQLYSTTNDILWHIANGVSGVIFLSSGIALFPIVGIIAIPLAILAGNAGFYAWYSARRSYRAFEIDILAFESRAALPPFLLLLIWVGCEML